MKLRHELPIRTNVTIFSGDDNSVASPWLEKILATVSVAPPAAPSSSSVAQRIRCSSPHVVVFLHSISNDGHHLLHTATITFSNLSHRCLGEGEELTIAAIRKIKRRIADLLEPGETVLQALRRLKGTSNNKKEKMSAETKLLFDQLTKDTMKLLENGEYDVYHDKQEVLEREAEGYERLAQAKGDDTSMSAIQGTTSSVVDWDLFSVTDLGAAASILPETVAGSSNLNGSTIEISNNDNDAFDMFVLQKQSKAGIGKKYFSVFIDFLK